MKFSNPHTQTQNTLSAAVFEHYTDKKQDRNLAQATDGYVHHHFGLGPVEIDVEKASQDEITAEIQRMENSVTTRMIQKLGYTGEVSHTVDLGCGRAGSMLRILDHNENCKVAGVNLNVYQSTFCNDLIRERGLCERAEVRQANFLSIPYPDNTFTHAYCCEVTQYALNLKPLFEEVYRVLESGGRYVIVTWSYNPEKSEAEIKEIVEPINDHYASTMHSITDYCENLKDAGFDVIDVEERSDELIPYWDIRTHWDMKSGIEDSFLKGHREGTLQYFFITAEKR